ncbi:hypothetical protein, partial [Escherichia coli]|uniref:hypothetical protein n=1 Tax=Escherichia coli TaxID=562 RepID=UPI001964954B
PMNDYAAQCMTSDLAQKSRINRDFSRFSCPDFRVEAYHFVFMPYQVSTPSLICKTPRDNFPATVERRISAILC